MVVVDESCPWLVYYFNTVHAGRVIKTSAVERVERVSNESCCFSVLVRDGVIIKLRFLAKGQSQLVALCEYVCVCLEGGVVTDILQLTAEDLLDRIGMPLIYIHLSHGLLRLLASLVLKLV